MKIVKHRIFCQWAKSVGLTDHSLKQAVNEIEKGLVDAHLGGGLYKKRIARHGRGKSAGYRTLLAFQRADKTIFMYGFAKNERENITTKEKDIYKQLAKYYLTATDIQFNNLIRNGELIEVTS